VLEVLADSPRRPVWSSVKVPQMSPAIVPTGSAFSTYELTVAEPTLKR
jgi:hypothetical protein